MKKKFILVVRILAVVKVFFSNNLIIKNMKEKINKWLNWIITIATALTVLMDKIFPQIVQ